MMEVFFNFGRVHFAAMGGKVSIACGIIVFTFAMHCQSDKISSGHAHYILQLTDPNRGFCALLEK